MLKKFHISVLGFSFMSQELITIEIIWTSLILIEIWSEMWRKSKNKVKCTVRKKFQSRIINFFILKLSQSNLL
jgi:hypothetical protein